MDTNGHEEESPQRRGDAKGEAEQWRVYRINECDWWLARSLEEAIADAGREYGIPPEEVAMGGCELTDEQLGRFQYVCHRKRVREEHSFAEELARRIADGPKVEMFATTEF